VSLEAIGTLGEPARAFSEEGGPQIKSEIVAVFGLTTSPDKTGEFDPGSERTLAARLTHASRTRKGFVPGTVAHG
jgi:hypothetical protein